jgi:uncharacterized protein with HEPN domain
VKRRDTGYLWDMLQAARDAAEIVRGRTFNEVANDKVLRLALERAIEIIGEAARRVSSDLRDQLAEIPWRRIIAQRNVIIHEYGELKVERLWFVATQDVPQLIGQLEPLLAEPPEEE